MTAPHDLISIFISSDKEYKQHQGEVFVDLFTGKDREIFKILEDLGSYTSGELLAEHHKRFLEPFPFSDYTPNVSYPDTQTAILLTKQDYFRRESKKVANEILERVDREDPFDTIARIDKYQAKVIATIESSKTKDTLTIVRETIKEIELSKSAKGLTGIETKMSIDKTTGGWQNGDLIIIAARPAMGKTAHVLNQAIEIGRDNHVAIFSLEMGSNQLMRRMIAIQSDTPLSRMKDQGDINWDEVQKAGAYFANGNFHLYDNKFSIHQIIGECRKLHSKKELNIIIIDYLQLIDRSGRNANEDLGNFTRKLKLLARELDVPIILLSQLSRGVEKREDKRPILSDLRDSGAIEQDADIVCFLFQASYYDKEDTRNDVESEFIISKHRQGSLCTHKQIFTKSLTKFTDDEPF